MKCGLAQRSLAEDRTLTGVMTGTRPRGPLGGALALGIVLGFASCATPGSDIHLAPFWTQRAAADAAWETEAFGGFYLARRDAETDLLEFIRFGPIYSYAPLPRSDDDGVSDEFEGAYVAYFLVPLGISSRHGIESSTALYPFFIAGTTQGADGTLNWKFASLPGVLLKRDEVTGFDFAVFPIYGEINDFLTFDKLRFVLWPLYVYAEREERISYHLPWPLLGWTTGGGESSFRLWPLYSRTKWEGRFDRTNVLWPFFHYHRNFLGGGGEEPETKWMIWPLYGHTERGTFEADTVLWPFFGYSSDPRSGFWALDAPWPFVRFQRGPDGIHRSRVWPFYSYTKADGLETTAYLWPIVQFRHEESDSFTRDSAYVIPLWQSWDRLDKETGETSAWRKLWPAFQYERQGAWERGSFPALDPFWRNDLIDDHYSWIWKLWEWEQAGAMKRERAWLGLYYREKGLGEDRRSFTALWSSRRYRNRRGSMVKETSLLFGLFRWRVTEDEGFDMLAPAFPGPGWPAPGTTPAAVPIGPAAPPDEIRG